MPLAFGGDEVRSLTGEAGCLIRQAFLLADALEDRNDESWRLMRESVRLGDETFSLGVEATALGLESFRLGDEWARFKGLSP